MEIVEHWARLVTDLNSQMRGTFPPDTEPRAGETMWYVNTRDERFWCTRTGSNSFILFMSDFCLAFDEENHLVFVTCPMLPHPILQSSEKLSFDDLLDDVPEPQVHFIARRLVQLTRMSWQFDCLAKFEKALPGAERLGQITDLFMGSSVYLEATTLDLLVGCRVGLIRRKPNVREVVPCTYQVGLDMFGTVFGLSTLETGIRHPQVLESGTMSMRKEITDFLTMSLVECITWPSFQKTRTSTRFRVLLMTMQWMSRTVSCKLGYGKQMSAALGQRAADLIMSSETVTLQGTLDSLIQAWNNVSDLSMIPLTLLKRIRRTRRETGQEGDSFLILIDGKLYIARSVNHINKSLTVGLNTGFVQASAGFTKVHKDVTTQSMVTSMFDAVAPSFTAGSQVYLKEVRIGTNPIHP